MKELDVYSDSKTLPKVQLPTVEKTGDTSLTQPELDSSLESFVNSAPKPAVENKLVLPQQEMEQLIASGMSEDDADLEVIKKVKLAIQAERAEQYTDQEITEYLVSSGFNEDIVGRAIKSADIGDKEILDTPYTISDEEKAQDISDTYKNIYSKYSTTGKTVLGIFNTEQGIEARREIAQLNYAVVEKLKADGINAFIRPNTSDVMMVNEAGQEVEVDSSMLSSLYLSKGEIAGGVVGGIAGLRRGAVAGAAAGVAFPPIAPVSTVAGGVVGGIVGSASGAAAGRGVDLFINSKKIGEELEAKLYLTQMKEAAIFDAVVGVAAGAVIKAGVAGGKRILKAYEYVKHGNPNGALKALKENLNITTEQAKEIVQNFEAVNQTKKEKKAFSDYTTNIIIRTQPNAESAAKLASNESERVATILRQEGNTRAKNLIKTVKSITDDKVAQFVKDDLKTYQEDVKEFFRLVKSEGSNVIDSSGFAFDLDKTAIKPVLLNIERNLSDPYKKEAFVSYASRIDAASSDRTFSGLLELRTLVNDFKYTKTVGVKDKEALNTVIQNIDSQINKAAIKNMPETGKEWIKNWSLANSEYSKMKITQQNALYELITRSKEQPIQEEIVRYAVGNRSDLETLSIVLDKVSPATRIKVEGALINKMVSKNTVGKSSETQAINFPQLSVDLNTLNITTQTAKNMKTVIDKLATVYKNDPVLSNLNGRTSTNIGNSIATTGSGKAKSLTVQAVFGTIVRYTPTQTGRNLALVSQAEKLLKDPLHSITAEKLFRQLPKESVPAMKLLVKDLQIEAAKVGPKNTSETITLYKPYGTTKGALGKGMYLSKRKVGLKQEVQMSQMATLDDISSLVGRPVTNIDIKEMPTVAKELSDRGFTGIRVNDRYMMFTEESFKVPKKTKSIKRSVTKETIKAEGKRRK